VTCEKCKEYLSQIKEVRDELNSMRIINELLQKELSTHAAPHSTWENGLPNEHRTTIRMSYAEVAATGGKRNPALSSFTVKKKMTTSPARATHQTNMPNPFTARPNPNGIPTNEINARKNSEWTSSKSSRENHFNNSHEGNKIPTVINGRIMHVQSTKPAPTRRNAPRAPIHRNIRPTHKVKITGDSHLKGSAEKINQHLNTKFEVCSLIKPGACTNQIVHSQEIEFRALGKKDAIVINGGTNDIGNNSTGKKEAIVNMTQFLQRYSNTNIILINIPQRHDLHKASRINQEIQAHNTKLGKIASRFRHVTVINTDFNRNLFTNHGLHLNNAGKEGLAKLIATHIDEIIYQSNKPKPAIALNWGKESINETTSTNNNSNPIQNPNENDSPKATAATSVSPLQSQENQDNKTESEVTRKTSSRQKKVPVTRCKDFLWQM
jgi:hypothetical protein